ncbi:MAG: MATE family efflux transporter [Clostridiales bacterium]|nr:MATE family efflux transporter [Clostridiales bacterium]
MLKKYFGDKAFYHKIIVLTIPIIIQNGITNFVGMLDNVMIGQVGTEQMTGVAVANQLIFVFNLCVFGAVSGAGIFGAQFYGNGDHKGLRDTFRFKLIFCVAVTLLSMGVFTLFGDGLIGLYLRGQGSAQAAQEALAYGRDYLFWMMIGLLPYTIVQCYSSTLRETGQTLLPMIAGVSAVLINLCLNYILIFGHFGAPPLGVAGAAIATVISRFAELLIVVLWTHAHSARNLFIVGAYRSLRIPRALVAQIAVKGLPLMINESLWAAGMALLNQCYSQRSLDVVAAINISSTFWNVFSVVFLSFGVAIGILIGQQLGAGDSEGAKDSARKMITFSVLLSIGVGAVYAVCALYIPKIYNTTESIRSLATSLMLISAFIMPIDAFANAAYFTLRSGGKTFITFIFDSCFVWLLSIPVAYCLVHFTALPIIPLYAICMALNLIKCVLGYIFVKKGIWVRRIVVPEGEAA